MTTPSSQHFCCPCGFHPFGVAFQELFCALLVGTLYVGHTAGKFCGLLSLDFKRSSQYDFPTHFELSDESLVNIPVFSLYFPPHLGMSNTSDTALDNSSVFLVLAFKILLQATPTLSELMIEQYIISEPVFASPLVSDAWQSGELGFVMRRAICQRR